MLIGGCKRKGFVFLRGRSVRPINILKKKTDGSAKVFSIVINPVPFRPFRPVPLKNPGQNGDVFVPGRIPDRSGHPGRIPAGTPRFCTGGSVPVSAKRPKTQNKKSASFNKPHLAYIWSNLVSTNPSASNPVLIVWAWTCFPNFRHLQESRNEVYLLVFNGLLSSREKLDWFFCWEMLTGWWVCFSFW